MDCTSCGRANRPGARFCDGCGAALAAERPAGQAARKVVSILFADLIGSTSLQERLDAESVRGVMDRYYRALRAEVARHGGTVVKLLGDGLMAAFGIPRVGEDDALRAVRAAVAMQAAFRGLDLGGVGLRVAVNTGEVVVSDDHADVVGDPVNVAARLQEAAGDGDVLVGEATARIVATHVTLAPCGTLALKGRSESVVAHRVVSLERPAGGAMAAFVGRERELGRLLAVYDDAVAAPGARLAVVLGSPGLGKSRLVAEVERRVGDGATVVNVRCDAAGGATFAPVADGLRMLLGLDDGATAEARRKAVLAVAGQDRPDAARIAAGVDALLAGTPAPPEETFFVVRRLLAAVATAKPVVLAIDDLQWAEPLLLDLTEHLVEWSADVPLFVLVAARPELRDVRASLATPGGFVSEVVTLAGLDAAAATRLAADVIGADALPAAIAGRVLAASEGNPLFVGELVRMLVQDGVLAREGDRWTATAEVQRIEMPPTIHAVLAARIERLRPEERVVLERAAVVGRSFSRAAVAHLLAPELRGELDERLDALRRTELIEPDAGWFAGEPALRFHHALVRDAAYRRVLKETRAELHERLADWLVARFGDAPEHEEAVGWHLEQAHQLLCELGPLDTKARSLGERASRALGAAGRRALARDDVQLAAGLLARALARLDENDPARAELALDWSEALLSAGEVDAAARAVAELARFCDRSLRLRAWHACLSGQLAVLTDPRSLHATAARLAAAGEELTVAGDAAGEAKAYAIHALALARLGEMGACEASLDRALAAARAARDRRRANGVLSGAPQAALWGPSPVTRASGRCLDVVRVLRITQGAPAVEAVALRCQAVLEALRGRSEAARRMIASSRRLVEELGLTHRILETDVSAGAIELLEGDAAAAERVLRPAYEGLRRHGLRVDAAQAAALLGRALLAQGRADEAEALSHESEALAGDDLKAAIAWRGVRAEALARRGEATAAVALARAAVAIAEITDALLDHADACSALAVALRAAGREADARVEAARAVELWRAKGATLLAARAVPHGDHVDPARATADEDPRETWLAGSFANAAAQAQARFERHWHARDWAGVLASYAPGVRMEDRRSIVGMTLEGERFVASLRLLFDMVDARWRSELLATRGERLALLHTHFAGRDAEGTVFDAEHLTLLEIEPGGLVVRVVTSDVADVDVLHEEMDMRFEAGEGAPYAEVLANQRELRRAMEAMDAESLRHLLPPDFELRSHRRLGNIGERLDREGFLAAAPSMREAYGGPIRIRYRVLRVSPTAFLTVGTWSGTHEGGAFEIAQATVMAHDGRRVRAIEVFDDDQVDVVAARYEALTSTPSPRPALTPRQGELTREFMRALAERDWDALARLLAPDLEVHDHRQLGWELLRGPAEYVAALRALVDLAPDVRLRLDSVLDASERAVLYAPAWEGTREGGAFEEPSLMVGELDDAGRIRRFDQYDHTQEAEARARFAAATAAAGEPAALHGDPLRIPPNAVTRAMDRFQALAACGDVEGLAALLVPDFVFEDRRRGLRMTGDRDQMLASIRVVRASGAKAVPVTLATAGDRLALQRIRFTDASGALFEVETLQVVEVDAGGRMVTAITFDPDDRAAAIAEMSERYLRGEGSWMPRAVGDLLDAMRSRDLDRVRAALPPDFVFDDRRRTGLGRIEGRDAYVATLAALYEQGPDVLTETLYVVEEAKGRAILGVARMFGNVAGGGGFESVFVRINVFADGEHVATELYELDDLPAARARFAELTRIDGRRRRW